MGRHRRKERGEYHHGHHSRPIQGIHERCQIDDAYVEDGQETHFDCDIGGIHSDGLREN